MDRTFRSPLGSLALCTVLLCIAWSGARAAEYPQKTIRFVVGWPPGGASDVMARIVAQGLTDRLGQIVITDNRPGAAANMAANLVAKAEPDGYTIFLATTSFGINPSLYRNLPFDPIKDFTPVSLVARAAFSLVVNPSLPAKSVSELIELAKSKPGKLNYASHGNGSSAHLSAELFKSMTGTNIVMVPYNGGPPAATALIAGEAQVMFDSALTTLPLSKAGKMRMLAVTSTKRLSEAPNVPTVAETVPGYEVMTWFGVLAPASTPKNIIAKLNAEIAPILQLPATRDRLSSIGGTAVSSTPEELAGLIKREITKWEKVVRGSGIHVQ